MSHISKPEPSASALIDRRRFVKTSLIAAGAVGAMGSLAGCGAESQSSGEETTTAGDGTLMTAEAAAAQQWSFEVAPSPIADSDISETLTADIIVVGSGTSGLVTANSAAENGARVILISASSVNVSRGGSVHAMNSRLMQEHKDEFPLPDSGKFLRSQLACAGFNVDQRKWWKFNKNSEEAMDWLMDKMEAAGYTTVLEAGFDDPDGPMDSPVGSHSWIGGGITTAGSGQQLVVDTLAADAQAAGVEIYYNTVAKQLVREEDNTGRVDAVIAQNSDGEYIKYVGTRAIVLATGDFSADKDMMSKYCPQALPLLADETNENYDVGFTWGGLYHGEGQKMGLWVGAAWQKTYPNAPMTLAVGTAGPANQPCGAHRGLLVNKNGERYSNEDVTGVFGGLAQMHEPDMEIYALWSANYAEDAAPWYSTGMRRGDDPIDPAVMLENWKEGTMSPLPQDVVMGDTIEKVIEGLGLPADTTKATVDRYNGLAASGVDEDFCKEATQLIGLTTGPFFGAKGTTPKFLTVMGGLRTNVDMQVCDENDDPIPGLFNVGTMVGDYYANIYNFLIEGNNLGATCLTFGYTTGKAIATGAV